MSYACPPQGRNISPYNLLNQRFIGEGSFGKVYKALWLAKDGYEEEVAIKIMKYATWAQVMEERDRMAWLDHENVIGLRGIVQQDPCPWLVMEYAGNGDLLTNIVEWKKAGQLYGEKMEWISWNIAKGMKYLHDNDIVHGDLAARNILLDRNDVAKIGDLGYYDSQNPYNYYNYNDGDIPCPIRWMSPENLPYRSGRHGLVGQSPKKSYKGDVWAYGVVLFELWSAGAYPFDGYSEMQVCSFVLQKQQPTDFAEVHIRQHLRNVMYDCWQYFPENRPSFYAIVQHF